MFTEWTDDEEPEVEDLPLVHARANRRRSQK